MCKCVSKCLNKKNTKKPNRKKHKIQTKKSNITAKLNKQKIAGFLRNRHLGI